MKVFISWSGEKSQKIAIALQEWLQMVIQSIVPFVSKEDITKGDVWINAIEQELVTSDFGIVCITQENKNSVWMLFEAGALANKVGKAHMTPFLTDMSSSELDRPLSLYQTTEFNKEDVYKLLKTINGKVEQPLSESNLQRSYEMWWPKLQESINSIKAESEQLSPLPSRKKNTTEMLEEHTRMLQDIKNFLISNQQPNIRRNTRVSFTIREYADRLLYFNNKLSEEFDMFKVMYSSNVQSNNLNRISELIQQERLALDKLLRSVQDNNNIVIAH